MQVPRVLVVEDEALIALDTKKTLENLGYEVTAIAYSGKDAIRLAEETRPDIILMDIVLRDEMSGIETVRIIHEKQDIPVIYMTANADIATIEEARETGPYGYLNKPFGDRDLYSAIDTALYKHQMESRLQQSQQQLLDMMEAAPAAIIVYNRGGISYVNQECEKILGLDRNSLTGKNLWEFIHPEHRDLVKSRIESALDHEEDTLLEYDACIIKNTGEEYWIHFKTTYTTYNGIDSLLVHGLDISLQKNIEALLLQKTEELEVINEEMQSTIEEMEAVNEEFEATNEELTATNQELHESQLLYSSLFKYSKTPMLIIDPNDGSIIDANEAASEFYGYDNDTLVKMNINQINILSKEKVRHEMKMASSENRSYFIFRHRLSDGSVRDVEVYTGPVILKGEEYLYSLIHDITEKKLLEKNYKFHSMLLNQIQDLVTATDLEGNITYVNDAECRLLRKTRDELIGKPVKQYGSDTSMGTTQEEIFETVTREGTWHGEVVNYDADGNLVILDSRVWKIFDDSGKPIGLCGIATNITDRKMIEEELARSEKEKSLILNSTYEMYCYYNNELQIQWANQAAADSVAMNPEDMIGLHCYRLWHNRETPCENCPVLMAKETGKAHESELSTPDGRTWFLRGFPIFDEKGEITALVEFGQDITGRKEAEQQVLQALREKETLLSEIHHRVKNNFQVIISLLNFQSRSIKEPELRMKVDEIQQRIRAMALIHEKLYQTGNLTSIDFNQYASIIVTELNYAYSRQMDESLKKMVIKIEDITLNIEKAIPCGLIINELVSNSLKHAFPDDTIEDPCVTISMYENKNMVYLHISDNGVGLPHDIDPKNTQSMGMSLVPLLINQLNGTIEVDTSKGTTYNITFEK
ncbi:MAG: PAS domain S-box protein [Spirochaetota bacterium]